jgi:hypothetical protein
MPLPLASDAISLIWEVANEFAQPVPVQLRERFFARVRAALRDDEILSPHKIVAACAAVQHELMIAPAVDERPRRRAAP